MEYSRLDSLDKIKTPTLFTCGRYDMASPNTVQLYHSLLRGSELKVFEQSSHVPHIEEPVNFLKTIENFLNSHDNSEGVL